MRSLIVFFFCFLNAWFAYADDPFHIRYTIEDGLPSNNIFKVIQDSHGFIWVATDKGVSRFDGERFEKIGQDYSALRQEIYLIEEDIFGRVWLIGSSPELFYYWNGDIFPYEFNDSLLRHIEGRSVKKTFKFSSRDGILLGMIKRGWIRIDASGKVLFLKDKPGKHIEISDESQLLYSCRSDKPPHANSVGVNLVFGDQEFFLWGNSRQDDKFRKPNFYFAQDQDEERVFVSSHNYLYEFEFEKFNLIDTFRFAIDCLNASFESELLVGTLGGGIYTLDITDNSVKANYFEGHSITDILVTEYRVCYIGTQGEGLIYVPSFNMFKVYSNGANLIDTKIYGDSIIYSSFSDGSLIKFNLNCFKTEQIYKEATGRNNLPMYFGINNSNRIVLSDNFKLTEIKEIEYIPFSDINITPVSYFTDSEGVVYIASKLRLFKYKDGILSAISSPDFTETNSELEIQKIFKRHDSLVLLTSHGNLYSTDDGNTFDFCELNNNANNNSPLSIVSDWFRDGQSFYRDVDNDKSERVFPIIKLNRLKDLFFSDFLHLSAIRFTNHLSVVRDQDGIYVLSDLTKREMNSLNLKPKIDEIKLDTLNFSWRNATKLYSTPNSVSMHFNVFRHSISGNEVFEYRLLPRQKEWIRTTAKSVVYKDLSTGLNSFQVRIYDKTKRKYSRIERKDFYAFGNIWGVHRKMLLIIVFGLFPSLLVLFSRDNIDKLKLAIIKGYEGRNSQFELKALSTKMNPHFIFNLINSVQSFVMSGHKQESIYFLGKFSKLARDVLKNSENDFVDLDYEIQFLNEYMELENLRYDDKIKFKITINSKDNQSSLQIPGMLIQPLVENSIKHGFKPEMNHNFLIDVAIHFDNDFARINVFDSGVGIKSTLNFQEDDKTISHALLIIKKRLKILCAENDVPFSFNISDVKSGTLVSMNLPYLRR